MEGLRKVAESNATTVYQSDNQADWLKWRNSTKGQENVLKTMRDTDRKPNFPTLGSSKNNKHDDSARLVGHHNEVLGPTEIRVKRSRAQDEHLRRERVAENEYKSRKRGKVGGVTREDWIKLTEKDTNRIYYFNQKTGTTQYNIPEEFVNENNYFESKHMFSKSSGKTIKDYKEEIQSKAIATAHKALFDLQQRSVSLKSSDMKVSKTKAIEKTNSNDPSELWEVTFDPLSRRKKYRNKVTNIVSYKKPY